ncbi:hypothetical protein [Aquiluna sp. Uisw_065]|uniref:hypothetical protein n=1 Tax=Aquiluna sp. Uisw_065 TaxID=3230967 RepID=UPI0039E7F9E7
MINENTRYDPKHCGLYKPGHKTHFVQCNVMRDKKRYPAEVELVSPYSVRVKTEVQDEILYYHDAVNLVLKCTVAVDDDIAFSPEAQLLYVKTDGPEEGIKGAWFPAYLSKDELIMCDEVDRDSGYFQVRGHEGQ